MSEENEPAAVSLGQGALARLLSASRRMDAAGVELQALGNAMGASTTGTPRPGWRAPKAATSQAERLFFPALDAITADIERTADEILAKAKELAAHFR